jgi:histone-lysine N-methyltransferase SETMAR
MTQRQSNNQCSGGIAAHTAPKNQSAKIFWKFFTSIFWNQDGILLIYYHPKGQTINAEYYSSLLVQFKDILNEKHRGKGTKVFLFLHENAPARRALASQKKLAYLGFHYLDHLPYSPDLAPSDYHMFSGLTKQLKTRHFSSEADITAAWKPGWTDNIQKVF